MPQKLKFLVIDDDSQYLALIQEALEDQNVEIFTAADPEAGFEIFLNQRPRLVLLDIKMPHVSGMELLEKIVSIDPGVDVMLMTGDYTSDSAVEAIGKGACDYLTKPLDLEQLRSRISGFVADAARRSRTLHLDEKLLREFCFEGMISRSPLMLDVFARIRRMAPHFRTALVTGATGTGKELVAHALHKLSPAASGPFIICNCSALVETLVESELFGYVRGAFTGATQDKAGLFENANGGIIFLDEVGELSLIAQAKLLRILQSRQVQRLGSAVARNIDVRVIAATHRDLKEMVKQGQFREDLYYRIAVAEVKLPRLCDRREDMPLLQRYFIHKFCVEYNKPIKGLTRRAQSAMAVYPWPGNVRELENAIGNACMMTEGNVIDIADLSSNISNPQEGTAVSADETFLPLAEIQRRHILRVLEATGGNKARAAEILGVGRGTIYEALSRMKAAAKAGSN